MQDILTTLGQLRRPSILMRAARHGAAEYDRKRHLARLLSGPVPSRATPAVLSLLEIEVSLNEQRLASDAAYNLSRHIEVLIAIVGEARRIQRNPAAA
jgi:hypothetical protein